MARGRPRGSGRSFRVAGVRVTFGRDRILVGPDIVCLGKTGYFTLVAEPVTGVLRAGPYRLTPHRPAETSEGRPRAVSIDRAAIGLPAVVRSRRRGDRVPTAAGTTSLKKLLSEWGVPLEARNEVAVAADARGVIAAIALPWGAYVAERGRAAGRDSVAVSQAGGKRS
jgi:tRNA(Ile)-lysidine synthetase-like protein